MSVAREWLRYVVAGTVALAVDFGTYVALIRLADVNYLVAAPAGFALGLATIYLFSVRWIFTHRRIADARVEWAALSYEAAKIVSAGIVFCFNFAARKMLLFTRYT